MEALIEEFLPEIVDRLRQAHAVAMAAEETWSRNKHCDLDLLLEEQAKLEAVIMAIRMMRMVYQSQAGGSMR